MTEQQTEYAIAPHRPQLVSNFDEAARAAKAMAQSGYFSDAREVAQAMVKVLAGAELGFGPFASMTGIHVIKGKPTIGANLMGAAVKQHPRYDYRVARLEDDTVSITFYQRGDELGTSTFTTADAKDAGLTGRDNWRKYTRNMLFARAMSNGVRWYCPDVFAGSTVYTPDELGADEEEWDVIEGDVTEAPPEPQKPKPEPEPEPETSGNGSGDNGNYAAELKETKDRPYAAETLRDLIGISIGKKREEGFSFPTEDKRGNYRGALRANLDLCFAGDSHSTQKRHFVTEYLTGKASTKDLGDAEIKTLHRWLNARPNDDTGEWHPDPLAVSEAKAAARAAEKDAGQTDLAL